MSKTRKHGHGRTRQGNITQVFKVQLAIDGSNILIYNRNKSIMIQDDPARYEPDFILKLDLHYGTQKQTQRQQILYSARDKLLKQKEHL